MRPPPHLLTLADLTAPQIRGLLAHAHRIKYITQPWMEPHLPTNAVPHDTLPSTWHAKRLRAPPSSLYNKSIALLFSKRSTRTRLAAETSVKILGGHSLFLGKDDIQLGVNETLQDSAKVIGGMCQGIFARVGEHEEIEELAKHSPVPVINALSSLWHPSQILADLLTLHEHAHLFTGRPAPDNAIIRQEKLDEYYERVPLSPSSLPDLPPLTVAYVGDSANVLHDMLVAYPRLGHKLRVATPEGYRAPKPVWDRVLSLPGADETGSCADGIHWCTDPKEAVHGADVVVTDTWISMGQEAEKEQRLKDFKGYQVTEQLCKEGGAKPNWVFMHCLPRKQDEVDDEVFYGKRSIVFPEAENRRWTTVALFDLIFGKWSFELKDFPHPKKGKKGD